MDELIKLGATGAAVICLIAIMRLGLPPVIKAIRESMGTDAQSFPTIPAPALASDQRAGDQTIRFWKEIISQEVFLACSNTMAPLINAQTAIMNELKEILIEMRNEQRTQREAFVQMMRVQGEMSQSLAIMLERQQALSHSIDRRNQAREDD